MNRFNLRRRHILRAAGGVAITLPFLESLVPRSARAESASTAPKRFIAMVHPQGFPIADSNGAPRAVLYPATTGNFPTTLPATLTPLTARGVANEVMLIGGLRLDPDPSSVRGAHSAYTAGRVLIGKNYESASDAQNKVSSLDVAIHQAIGKQASLTTQRLTLTTASKPIYGSGSGLVDAHYETDAAGKRIFLNAQGESVFGRLSGLVSSGSYKNGVGQDALNNPRLVFNMLFCGGSANCPGGGTLGGTPTDPTTKPRTSVLHYVADRIARLKNSRQLGTADAQKIDQYLTGIEDIETRINATIPRVVTIPSRDTYRNIPSSQNQLGRLMVDLIVKAFEANLMNVASLMLGATDGSNINASANLDSTLWGITPNMWVHDHLASHGEQAYDGAHGKFAAATLVATQKVDVFAYLISQLKAKTDVTGTLLENTLIYYGSDFGNGHAHDVTNVPVMLAGRVPALVRGGTYTRLQDMQAMRVLVSAAAQFGVVLPQAKGQTGAF